MQLSDFGANKQQIKLDNGVPLIVFERPGMPISLKLAFFSGSRFDPVGKEGIAHFAEHMLVSGNHKFPTKQDIGTYTESLGARFNASTSSDKMDIYFDYADISDTSKIVDLASQFLSESLFSTQTLESERGAIRAELAGKISNPSIYIHRLWKKVAYQGSLVARDTIGTDQTITQITKQDLLDYCQNMLTTNRAVVVASGGVTSQELAVELNQARLFSRQDNNFQPPIEQTTRDNPVMTYIYPDTEQCHLTIGFPTVNFSHPDYWPLYVLSRILGGMRTSRMHNQLRNKLGLVYSASSTIDGWYGLSRICANTSCKSSDAQQVIDEIASIFTDLIQNSISNEELEHCKKYVTKIQKLNLQTSDMWVAYHINRILHDPTVDISVASDLDLIHQVSAEDVNRVAKKYIKPNAWYAAICGPKTADNLTINF